MCNKMFKNGKIMVAVFIIGSFLFGNSGVYTVSAAELAAFDGAELSEVSKEGIEIKSELEAAPEVDLESKLGAEIKGSETGLESELELEIEELEKEEAEKEETEINKKAADKSEIDMVELSLGLEELSAENEKVFVKYMQEIEIEEEEEPQEEKESVNLKEKIITIKGTKFVADTFHGVKALYRTGGNDGSNATYSCAAFVKRYYSQVYGVSVNNLLAGCTPISSKGTIRRVSSPKEGDIVATTSGSGNHWAIVKNVNNNGTITLIEQNWKWQQGGKTVAKVNRKVKASACKIYRLKK